LEVGENKNNRPKLITTLPDGGIQGFWCACPDTQSWAPGHIFAFPTEANLKIPPPLSTEHSPGNTSSSEKPGCRQLEYFRHQYIKNTSHMTRYLYAAAEC